MYNDRGNSTKKGIKASCKLMENEHHREGNVNDETSVYVDDAEESDMQISDESDEDLVDGIDDKEVHEKTAASVEDLPDLGEQCSEMDGDLQSSLADWAIEFGISLIALSALLSILKIYHPSLPKDRRTLLKTNASFKISSVAGGMFHYRGILNSIWKILDAIWSNVPDRHVFKLQLNFDGLPLFKSTSTQFGQFLVCCKDTPETNFD